VLTPRAFTAGGAFTAIEPSSDTPCSFPGTAASAPAARQLLRVTSARFQAGGSASFDPFRQDPPMLHR